MEQAAKGEGKEETYRMISEMAKDLNLADVRKLKFNETIGVFIALLATFLPISIVFLFEKFHSRSQSMLSK